MIVILLIVLLGVIAYAHYNQPKIYKPTGRELIEALKKRPDSKQTRS